MARIASMVARLTPPMIVQGDIIPSFGRICRSRASDNTNNLNETNNEKIQPYSDIHAKEDFQSLEQLCSSAIKHRVIFFGEQHHQPKVLSSQLQVVYHIWQAIVKKREVEGKGSPKLHIVFEQWSLEDQPFLNKINQVEGDRVNEILKNSNQSTTSEGFSLDHYAFLIKFAREIGANVWGGFPPRGWARIIAKGVEHEIGGKDQIKDIKSTYAFEHVQKLDRIRYQDSLSSLNLDKNDAKQDNTSIIPPLSVEQYHQIDKVSWAHRTYLKSMFSPDQRPLVPTEADEGTESPLERIGFTPAQALKDTFFAHTISTILENDPNNVIFAICGLGHCEWLFGAPERLRGDVKPFIILSKPNDSGFWNEQPQSKDQTQKEKGKEWQRKQAHAILLYDWVD